MLVGRLLATGQGADAEGLRGGAGNGASAASARSNEPGDPAASRPQTARSSAGRGAESGGSADRVKNPMFDQLVRSIRLSATVRQAGSAGRHSSARLQLNPPELGRMDVEVSVAGERARIVIKTQTDAARWLVQARASELVASLERHGIIVERMEVSSEVVADQEACFARGFGEPDDFGAADHDVAHGANRYSGSFHPDPNASEDASSQQAGLTGRPVEPDGEPVELAWRSESAVVAESRLDIRV